VFQSLVPTTTSGRLQLESLGHIAAMFYDGIISSVLALFAKNSPS
jgi:hypothetical protein